MNNEKISFKSHFNEKSQLSATWTVGDAQAYSLSGFTRDFDNINIFCGVKIEDGYDIYEEGVEKGYFCKREDGSDFVAAVWPGWTHFPDFLNKEAREWFGNKYEFLIDKGIDGFWNDMNEPAIFYTKEGVEELNNAIKEYETIMRSYKQKQINQRIQEINKDFKE